jgi:ketosteroid isomerase-like protein
MGNAGHISRNVVISIQPLKMHQPIDTKLHQGANMKISKVIFSVMIAGFIMTAAALTASAGPEDEIKAVLQSIADAYGKRDVNAIMSCFSDGPKVVFSDGISDEPITTPEMIRKSFERDFANTQSYTIQFTRIFVGTKGDVGWFLSSLVGKVKIDNEEHSVPAQWSGVMEKTGGKWRIVQSHFSYVPTLEDAVEEPVEGQTEKPPVPPAAK